MTAPRATTSHETVRLWPDGAPSTLEGVGPEREFSGLAGVAASTTMVRNVSDPTLTVFRPGRPKPNGIGVIVCPGGGWRILAWQHEGIDVSRWLADRGYTAFLLKYRVMGTPRKDDDFRAAMRDTPADEAMGPARTAAADDGRRAVGVVRQRAQEWGIDPRRVGMIGFSAGAFLVADVAMDPRGAPPLAFAACVYGGETQGRPVPADAPPLFTTVAADDRRFFKVVEGLHADWSNADRDAEIHVFAGGGHGFGMVHQGSPSDLWIDRFGDWLVDRGFG